MTKSKSLRLINELIAKYGDVVVAKIYDYWLSKTYVKEGEDTSTTISEIHLSQVQPTTIRSDIEKLTRIASGKEGIDYIPVYIQESKDFYDSPEQTAIREREEKNHKKRVEQLYHYATYLPLSLMGSLQNFRL